MQRPLLSALAVASVLGVAAAATFDSLRGGEPPAASPRAMPPPCREGQLALDLVARDDPPVIVLRHARGPNCTVPAYDTVVHVVAEAGTAQDDLILPIDVSGLSAPGVQSERTFRYHPRCNERGPFHAIVRVGPYSVRGVIPTMPCHRTPREIAAFHRDCVRSWNAPSNRSNQKLIADGEIDSATLFRSSDSVEVERCGVHVLSSATAQSLVAYRVDGHSWSLERGRPDGVYDDRSVEVRQDGTLALMSG